MTAPILATKLFIPAPRPKLVPRPRLIERLNEGLQRRLTLISAPAGFGKTTLVSEWVNDLRLDAAEEIKIENRTSEIVNRAAWLSLDEGDADLVRFLSYLVAALQKAVPEIGAEALAKLLASQSQPPPVEEILVSLLNELISVPGHFLLVVDDYHAIEDEPVDRAMSFLIDHMPPQMHLFLITRQDPQLPLARYRARDQLLELRAADLRFTSFEAAEFLNQVMGLNLSPGSIDALETRTEGWIAGLQLAALSMQGHTDTAGFIQAFTGSHHFVLDYLIEEVLHRQSERIQAFLLGTSILDRLCGPLCDAVLLTPSESGQETLEYLEHANLFLVPLDHERRWYRYHRLFADLLRQRLYQSAGSSDREEGESWTRYHIRASVWYEENDFPAEAFHHALAAGNFERAANLAELGWQALDRSFQSADWLGWVKELPDELIRKRPVLSTQYAQALMDAGELEASESRLRDAERWLDPAKKFGAPLERDPDEMVVVDKEMFRTLPAKIALTRAYNAQSQGDFHGSVMYAQLALERSQEDDSVDHGGAAAFLGIANWAQGNLPAAQQAMTDWMTVMQKAGNIVFAIATGGYLAEIIIAQGHLRQAVKAYQQSLQLASEHDRQTEQVTAPLYLGLAMLSHEMGDPEGHSRYLSKSRELSEITTLPDWPCRWRLAQARLKGADGDFESALDLLDEAKRLYVRVPVPDIRPIEAMKARVYVRQGKLAQARNWAKEGAVTVDDELSYLREFEHITLARILIAQGQHDQPERSILHAAGLLDRLLQAAEEGNRLGSMIEILVLRSLVQQALGDIPGALAALSRALLLAEPEGFVRIFVDEGEPVAELLTKLKTEKSAHSVHAYIQRLLAAFEKSKDTRPLTPSFPSEVSGDRAPVEPLSRRELEVLGLIAQGLSNLEIGERLFLAVSTVKGHNLRIFGKLQVENRTQAVARARELGLL